MTKARDLANASTALSAVSATELGYLDGVTSAVQTQIDAKLASSTAATTYVANSLADAKGDLFVASADNTVTRLPVGSTGDTIVADSSTSTGLRYQGSIAGGKNFAINGGMDIWQRGTTFTSTGAGYSAYTTDRWTCYAQGTGTITQDTSLSASGFRYGLKFTSTAASSGNDFYQLVETDQTVPLAGKQVAVSGYCIATSGVTPIMNLEYSTTVNDGLFGSYVQCTATTISQPTATGSLLRYTYSFAVPTTAKTLRLRASTGTLNNTNYATWTGVQLEVGNVPTSFSRAGGTIQGESSACMRYYERRTVGGANYGIGIVGVSTSTTASSMQVTFATPKRVNASVAFGGNLNILGSATNQAVTSINGTYGAGTASGGYIGAGIDVFAASGLTSGAAVWLRDGGAGTAYIEFSAEL